MNADESPYGFVVVGGVRLPIVELRFADGALVLVAETPDEYGHAVGPITVFGVDGVGVCQGTAELTLDPNKWPNRCLLHYTLRVGSVDDAVAMPSDGPRTAP